jgi:misacylated tRNA(Ala) deacylase
MAHLFCHTHPDVLQTEAEIIDARPGMVSLSTSPFYPGGGGQLADIGVIRWSGGEVPVTGFERDGDRLWHLIDWQEELDGIVQAEVDATFRRTMQELHTGLHILNAFVYHAFQGALVTGVQMYGDGTARMDFDIPGADKDRLRQIEGSINDVIAQDLNVTAQYVPLAEAREQHGLIRSKSVAPPPTDDGKIRIVEIASLDRQACGGTHLASTGQSSPIQILKIDNKGRHNRRVRIGLVRKG